MELQGTLWSAAAACVENESAGKSICSDAGLQWTPEEQAAFRGTISASAVKTSKYAVASCQDSVIMVMSSCDSISKTWRSGSQFQAACPVHESTKQCSRRPCATSSLPTSRLNDKGSSDRLAMRPLCQLRCQLNPIPDRAILQISRRRI